MRLDCFNLRIHTGQSLQRPPPASVPRLLRHHSAHAHCRFTPHPGRWLTVPGLMCVATVDIFSAESLPTTTTEHKSTWELIFFLLCCLMETGWGARTPCCSPFLSQSPFTLPPRNDQQSNGSSPLLLRAHCINEPQSLLTTAYACARQRQRGRGGRGREEEMGSGGREILTLFKAQAPNGVMKILPYIYC